MDKLTAEAVTNEFEGSVVDPNTGEEKEVIFKDPTQEELDEFRSLETEAQNGDSDAETELQNLLLDEYLIEPELEPSETGLRWKQAIYMGFIKSLGGSNEAIEDARETFKSVEAEGNGSTSQEQAG